MQNRLPLIAMTCVMALAPAATAGETPAPTDARLYFINLTDNATVSSPLLILFGLSGMGVAPAGVDDKDNTGHHHLVIDGTITGEALNAPIPSDEQHRHFGKGQTETQVELPPGTHTLQLVLGDWSHIPHNPPVMSKRITVTVK